MSGPGDPDLSVQQPVLQALLDVFPGTLHVKDRALRYRLVNRYYAEHWGMRPEEFIGKRATELFGDEFDAPAEARDRQVLDTGRELPFYEVEFPVPSGGVIALWATKMPIFNGESAPSHVLTFALDVSSLKRAERALNQSELMRSAMVQGALDAIVAIDEQGVVVEFNPAAEVVFGHTRDVVLGRNVADVLIPHRHRHEHLGAMDAFEAGSLARRGGRRFQTEGLRADGSEFPVEIAVAEIVLDGRSIFTAHIRDLTGQKAVEAERDRQREALHHRNKLSAMGTLMASISHEIKNPLSVVVGQALLLQETCSDPRVEERAQHISAAAQRCSSIVSSFLDSARQRPSQMRPLCVNQVLDDAIELTRHLLRAHDIELQRHYADAIPPVVGDAHQLGQVVINLIVNAQQAMTTATPPHRLRVATRFEPARQRVVIDVSDSGPGLSESVREKLFTPFFTTRGDADGTGLGLAICSDIIAAHDGEITAANAPDSGACFTIHLPAHTDTQAPAEAEPSSAAGSGEAVLVVDDEAEVLELLAEILELAGYRVHAADSAETALRLLEMEPVSAVLSDVRMPGMSGVELFNALQRVEPALTRRFALITGEIPSAALHTFVRRSGVRVLHKPITPAEVVRLVQELLPPG
jgi:two-component system NtrC family sensor kinase